MESIFSRLPEAFFMPLACPNRRHYSALLLIYYRLFMEYRSGVERELVMARFSEYFTGLDASDRVEEEEDASTAGPEDPALQKPDARGLDAAIPEILHAHYDVYMHEVVDRAYTRLKTSDNLSRYRPRISRAVSRFLEDGAWMARTAEKLSIIQRTTAASGRERVREMLVEIRDDLKGIDLIKEMTDRSVSASRSGPRDTQGLKIFQDPLVT